MTQKIKQICIIALVLSLLLCDSAYAAASPFPDIAGHWAEGIITTLAERGVVKGFPDGTARPDNIITRGEFAALLARYLKFDTTKAEKESPTFDDIEGHWSEKNIEALVDSGILDPADYNGSLLPNGPITRIEIIRMMVRAIGKGEEAKQFTGNTSFKDDNTINTSDKGYVILATKFDLVTGYPDNTIRPDGESTRAEAFALLLRQEEALDKIKKEIEEKEIEKDEGKEQSPSSPGGGSAGYPEAQVAFELPAAAHTDTSITVTPVLKYTKTLTWSLTREDADGSAQPLDLAEAVDGSLNKEGGTIVFKESGSYTLTATATNYSGKTTSCSQSITVYPVVSIAFELPQYTHTDKTVSIEVATTGPGNLDIVWSATRDGEVVAWDTAIDGILTNEGGTITFKEKGRYGITATVTDDTGRSFSHSSSITVYPLVGMSFDLPEKAHTDTTIDLTTTLSEMDGLTAGWSLTRNGEAVTVSDYLEGELTNKGGTIRFKEKGVYALTATVTDDTGRSFKTTSTITVYPVGAAGFYLPEITHTDTFVTVEAAFQNIDTATAVWTLTKDGRTVALNDYVEGTLTNDGGSIRFTHKGKYILKAAFTDGAGRTYSYTSAVTVYPVPKLAFKLPATAHTDTAIPVVTTAEDMDGLTVEWLVDNTYGFQDWATYVDGKLDNDGGTIRFKRAGVYELVARVNDATGRVFLFEYGNKTEVHPVLSIRFELPQATHTDRTIDLRTTGNIGVLPIEWSITKDGKPVSFENYVEGTLNAQGGKIRFTEDGEYTLTAAMTDALGRSFEYTAGTKVYPVPKVEFTLPEAVHTDKTVDVAVTATKLGSLDIEWSMTKNDEAVQWQDFIDGTLTNEGGSIRFTDKGSYTLYATITDGLGRRFEYTANTEVYPIPKVEFTLPETAYTDKAVDVAVAATELGSLDIVWSISRNGEAVKWEDCIDGTFTNEGGTIRFKDKGAYVLKATITDGLGRSFEYSASTQVYPVPAVAFNLPEYAHTDTQITISPVTQELGALGIVWTISKDGGSPAAYSSYVTGALTNTGGNITFKNKGSYLLTANVTDETGRVFTYAKAISIRPVVQTAITLPQTAHIGTNVAITTQNTELGSLNILWELKKDGNTVPFASYTTGTLTNSGGALVFNAVGNYTLIAKVTDDTGRIFTSQSGISIYNNAPGKPVVTANVTRTVKDGKFLVAISASSTDTDNDAITYEYTGKAADNYYSTGTHTVQVRAKDEHGAYSAWAEVTFTVTNQAPSTPVITRAPNGNSVPPNTPVTITAVSTDPEGDAITYVWEGRPSETAVYPLGKNTIRVKAVDAAGAESPWTAIVFFVADSTNGGGMTLTGPESVILENGIEGATITEYTFTVPPVSGHSGSDYGRVRGYNVLTGVWDQLDYQTTTNGITFSRTLTPGIYTRLEFYYYTNHNCMYNKSNITYSVKYYFE